MRDPIVPQLQGDEFLLWEARQSERFELHHGFIVASAGTTFANQRITRNLIAALGRAFASPCETFGSETKICVSESTYYYADAGVVRGQTPDDATIVAEPTVVCEVLSKRTRSYDLIEKRAAYRSIASLRFYLIVDTAARRIEIDSPTWNGTWKTEVVTEGDFGLGETRITLSEIYARTSIGIDRTSP